MATNKQKLLTLFFNAGKKLHGPSGESGRAGRGCSSGGGAATAVTTEVRPVLEEFVYGLCRENATADQAQTAYRRLRERFFDWNEVRVSSQREIEDALAGLSGTDARAQRLISFLQEVFETTFSFSLEDLHKQGIKQAAKKLSRYQATNDYVGAWVLQRCLGGHAIPVDAPTLRCARRMGLIEGDPETPEAARSSLEHQIPKAKGTQFTDIISGVAGEFCLDPEPRCGPCPLTSECATGQQAVAHRGTRQKPR